MIKASSIMTKEVVTISKNSNIIESAELMLEKSLSSLIVVDNDKPIATISENDIVKGIVNKKSKVNDIMSKDFMVIEPNTSFHKVTNYLRQDNIKRFPVVENDKLVGIITETDIVETTRDFTRIHQIIQEVILGVFGLATAFFLFYFSPMGRSFFG